MKKQIVAVVLLLAIVAAAAWWLLRETSQDQIISTDSSTNGDAATPRDTSTADRHAATGWSEAPDARVAVREAMAMARKRLGDEKVVFAYVAPTVGYDVKTVMDEVNTLLDPGAKVYGITSAMAVMTDDGFHDRLEGTIAILLVGENAGVRFGVGSVDGIDPKGLEEQGAEAVRRTIADAGMPPGAKPDFILYCGDSHYGGEMKILDGIADVVGKDVLVVGGNARDNLMSEQRHQFTRDAMHSQGLVLAAMFTEKKIGWAFESGFRLTETGGVVTKANEEGTLLYEINGRPALDVYDEWLGGKLIPVLKGKTRAELARYTGLNPICRVLKGDEGQVGYLVAHPIPTQENLEDRALPVYSQILEGSEIRLFAGQWQNLLNRAEKVTSKALYRAELRPDTTAFGVMYFCFGARKTLPQSEVPTIPLLVKNQIPGVPFIGVFTGGEQGPLPGIRNVNCNLVVSMVLLEKDSASAKP